MRKRVKWIGVLSSILFLTACGKIEIVIEEDTSNLNYQEDTTHTETLSEITEYESEPYGILNKNEPELIEED